MAGSAPARHPADQHAAGHAERPVMLTARTPRRGHLADFVLGSTGRLDLERMFDHA
jgi:hypothetical protein